MVDSTFDLQVNCGSRLSIGLVDVRVAIVLQATNIDRADTSGSMSYDANVFRKADVGLAYAAFNIGGQIRLAVAREVNIHLARTEMQIQPRKRKVAKMQIALPSAHVN